MLLCSVDPVQSWTDFRMSQVMVSAGQETVQANEKFRSDPPHQKIEAPAPGLWGVSGRTILSHIVLAM